MTLSSKTVQQRAKRRSARRAILRLERMGLWLAVALAGGAASAVQAAPSRPDLELSVAQTRSLPLSISLARGQIEHRQLALRGVLVRGGYETVRIRPDGTQVVLASRYPEAPPQLAPADARVDPASVPGLIAAARGLAEAPELEAPPRLVYLLILGRPVLAWEAQLALTMRPEPSRLTLWVSAATGRVLREVEQVRSSRARVFAENPSATPEPIEVQLLDIDVNEAGQPLVGTRVQAFNCVGEPPEEISPWWDEGECYPLQTVFSDEAGDFFVPTPDVIKLEDNIDASDPYAELSMYVHGELFLEAMQAKGVEQFKCELSTMMANVRDLEPTSTQDYSPLNNAYYTNQCDAERGPTMVFGQGSEVDFGYDADVIYHELGHGMVSLLTPEGLFGRRLRPDGALVDASGINEAMADYFSVMLTDDPHLADYVGRFWSATSNPFIRDAENDKSCPDDTIGQVHNDGEPFMAALWATRKRLDDEGKNALDLVVIEALTQMNSDSSLEEAALLIIGVAEDSVGLGPLSGDDIELLRRSFAARGLLDCPRIITDPKRVRDGRTLFLRRLDDAVYPFYPGPMQLRYEVPPDGDDMVMRFTLKARRSSDPVEAQVLIKRGDQPITFEYQLVAVGDPPLQPEEDAEPSDDVQELVLVTGDWDLELSGTEVTEDDYELRLEGLEPGEVLHVAMVNLSPTEAIASETMIHASSELPDDEEEESETGMGSESGELPAIDEVAPGRGQSGCACRLERGGEGGRLAWLWPLLLVAGSRRRTR